MATYILSKTVTVNLAKTASGYCYHCRNLVPAPEDRLAAAIEAQKKILCILELRQNQKSFAEIAGIVGMSKSAVYGIYRRALQLPDLALPIEIEF